MNRSYSAQRERERETEGRVGSDDRQDKPPRSLFDIRGTARGLNVQLENVTQRRLGGGGVDAPTRVFHLGKSE